MSRPKPIEPGPGQRSVWDFPRPPAIEPVGADVSAEFGGVVVASSKRCVRVLETSHPPVYYFPPEDVRTDLMRPSRKSSSFCEWKGRAQYFDLEAPTKDGVRRAEAVAFAYPDPTDLFAAYADWISFYCGPLDACFVGDERAEPQPGEFYNGWITGEFVGPFKGEAGSMGW